MTTKNLARVGGLLYLAVAIAGGFSEYVRTSNTVSGDAAATAANVANHATLLQLAFATDLADLPLFLAVGIVMYVIFRPVNGPIALAMLVLNAVSVPIQALNMLNHAGALLVATQPQFAAAGSPALILLLLDLHRVGYLVAQIFFGLYLLPLGYLVYRSRYLPRAVGAILMVGSAGYVGGVAASFAAIGFESGIATYLGLAGGVAELIFLVWLLVRGVDRHESTREPVKGALKWTA
jgi:Domain of unknown function (DUF4386)